MQLSKFHENLSGGSRVAPWDGQKERYNENNSYHHHVHKGLGVFPVP